jgi:hypothetical protein
LESWKDGIMEGWVKKMKNIFNSLNPRFHYSNIPLFLLEE